MTDKDIIQYLDASMAMHGLMAYDGVHFFSLLVVHSVVVLYAKVNELLDFITGTSSHRFKTICRATFINEIYYT